MADLSVRVQLKLSPGLRADADRVRGDVGLSTWIRRLMRAEVDRVDARAPVLPIPGQLEVPVGDGTPVVEIASRRQRVRLLPDRAA